MYTIECIKGSHLSYSEVSRSMHQELDSAAGDIAFEDSERVTKKREDPRGLQKLSSELENPTPDDKKLHE